MKSETKIYRVSRLVFQSQTTSIFGLLFLLLAFGFLLIFTVASPHQAAADEAFAGTYGPFICAEQDDSKECIGSDIGSQTSTYQVYRAEITTEHFGAPFDGDTTVHACISSDTSPFNGDDVCKIVAIQQGGNGQTEVDDIQIDDDNFGNFNHVVTRVWVNDGRADVFKDIFSRRVSIESFISDDYNVDQGEQFTISWNVNWGTREIFLEWSGAVGSGSEILDPVENQIDSRSFTPSSCGDADFSLTVSGPGNNGWIELPVEEFTVTVNCPPPPPDDVDLEARALGVDPSSPLQGQNVNFDFWIRENEDDRDTANVFNECRFNGNPYDTWTQSFDAGEQDISFCPYNNIPVGTHTFEICTDVDDDEPDETNENNNCDSVQVTVSEPPEVDLKADGSDGPITVDYGDDITLSWTTSNANSCTASGSWSGNKNKNGGSQNRNNLTSNQTYTITCNGAGGSDQDTVVVNVGSPPPTVDLRANGSNGPITVDYNDPVTLSWTVTNATSCTASGSWSGNKNKNGGSQSSGALTSDSTFTITCNGAGGSDNDTVVVNVNDPEGRIRVRARLNGNNWTGSVSYNLLGPESVSETGSVWQNYNNVLAGNWTLVYQSGGPAQASLGSITPASSQTLTDGGTITFYMEFATNPPNAPSNLQADVTACEQATLTWTDNSSNEDGFRVYRNQTGGFDIGTYTLIDTKSAGVTTHVDSPTAGQSYYYAVTAFNIGGESALGAGSTVGPVFVSACTPNYALSSKSIELVNGQSYTGQDINAGDTVRFRITISNTGNATGYDVYVTDTLSDNLTYAGDPRLKKGSGANNSISATVNGQNITFDAAQNLGDDAADGQNWLLRFDATVNDSASQSIDFFRNDAIIRYALTNGGAQDQSKSVSTGSIPFRTGAAKVPTIREVAP